MMQIAQEQLLALVGAQCVEIYLLKQKIDVMDEAIKNMVSKPTEQTK